MQLNHDGSPQRVAVAINDAVLNSLPVGIPPAEDDMDKNMKILPFDGKATVIPFDHVGLDWNPVGHPPEGIYPVPHFDVHFYMISVNYQMSIPPYEVDPSKFVILPPADYIPPTYVYFGGGVPQMGSHLFDATSPELDPVNPQPFTQTFVYGSYDGKVIFYEPMITLAFLQSTTNFERSIPQPAKFQSSGYFPTIMRVTKADGITNVILDGFVYRTAS